MDDVRLPADAILPGVEGLRGLAELPQRGAGTGSCGE